MFLLAPSHVPHMPVYLCVFLIRLPPSSLWKYGCRGFRGAAPAGRTAGSWDGGRVRAAARGEEPPRDPAGRGEAAISDPDAHLARCGRRQSVRRRPHTGMQSVNHTIGEFDRSGRFLGKKNNGNWTCWIKEVPFIIQKSHSFLSLL